MAQIEDTDSLPLNGDTDLTAAERLMLRKMMRDEERASWARRKLRIVVPAGVAMVVGLWHLVEWARANISWK